VNDVDEQTMIVLKKAGLISVSLGAESGVQRILDSFRKDITPRQTQKALAILDRLGIPAKVYIIFFEPYMTLPEARENLAFLKRLRSFDGVRFENIIFRKLIPVSGSDMIERLKSDGLLRGNYLDGHSFIFKDKKIDLLSDFLEALDVRFEGLCNTAAFRTIEGLYDSFKREFEFKLAEKAIDFLETVKKVSKRTPDGLQKVLGRELRKAFGQFEN
jgi:radical SAM superfamily enzyme YgiQ (UPF0313 family)